MEKFAVYVLMVEDTEANDERIAHVGLDYARIGGDMTFAEASDAVMDVPVLNYDKAD